MPIHYFAYRPQCEPNPDVAEFSKLLAKGPVVSVTDPTEAVEDVLNSLSGHLPGEMIVLVNAADRDMVPNLQWLGDERCQNAAELLRETVFGHRSYSVAPYMVTSGLVVAPPTLHGVVLSLHLLTPGKFFEETQTGETFFGWGWEDSYHLQQSFEEFLMFREYVHHLDRSAQNLQYVSGLNVSSLMQPA